MFPQVYKAIAEAVVSSGDVFEEGVDMVADAARQIGDAAKESASDIRKAVN